MPDADLMAEFRQTCDEWNALGQTLAPWSRPSTSVRRRRGTARSAAFGGSCQRLSWCGVRVQAN